MDDYIKIHKAGGVLIKDRKALAVRSHKDKEHFLIPGGKIEKGETHLEALKRELKEELGIEVGDQGVEHIGSFFSLLDTRPGEITVEAFVVNEWQGEPSPCSEIVEFYWSDSTNSRGIKLGSVFEKQILPWLKERDLID
jgi:8-oxo-dGTP pyrophosphatase MutT (NUDIX family)